MIARLVFVIQLCAAALGNDLGKHRSNVIWENSSIFNYGMVWYGTQYGVYSFNISVHRT